ncbi:unnamed protein product [Linum trigynum]|uniref:PAP-specific phosphatase, mitochondrial n=1 Tax=Linum trigynum TaxID=586398 RepID=A0AAV2DQU5_9ROSI
MNLVNHTSVSLRFSTELFSHRRSLPLGGRVLLTRASSLPFPANEAKHRRELEAAIGIVERACRICVDVQSSVRSSEAASVEKSDSTPVTIADFGVQAFVSFELHQAFPAIPLVAEEDSGFLRANNLLDSVLGVVADKSSSDKPLTRAQVLEAIDRGGKNAIVYENKPATYWILDPIDGTKGFLKGSGALYVVGLALVVEGEIVLGVMGCPNWDDSESFQSITGVSNALNRAGIVMAAHIGCGTWRRRFQDGHQSESTDPSFHDWSRCLVDGCLLASQARFCMTDSATWESLPLSPFFSTTTDAAGDGSGRSVVLLKACCGSLSRYIMVALGIASVFILLAKPRISTKVWDHAVGLICVHEAGGKVTDWAGADLNLAEDGVERRILYPAVGVLATNGKIHNQIVEMISVSSSTG